MTTNAQPAVTYSGTRWPDRAGDPMTTTDRTWAIRIETPGLEPVVTGPLTRDQADVLAGMYLDQDREDALENDGPTRRRITAEEYDPTEPDLTPLIPEGEERTSWLGTAIFAALGVAALYFAFGTYHLHLATPRAQDMPIAVCLAVYGVVAGFLAVGESANAAWTWLMGRWMRSSRKRPAEVTS